MAEYVDYSKKFTDFAECVKTLVGFVPDLAPFFKEATTEKEAINNLVEAYLGNAPTTDNPNFPYTYTFKTDSRGISFNTDRRVNFGWRARIQEDGVVYTFRVSFPNAVDKSVAEINLKADGWEINKYETKRRFVNKAKETK